MNWQGKLKEAALWLYLRASLRGERGLSVPVGSTMVGIYASTGFAMGWLRRPLRD